MSSISTGTWNLEANDFQACEKSDCRPKYKVFISHRGGDTRNIKEQMMELANIVCVLGQNGDSRLASLGDVFVDKLTMIQNLRDETGHKRTTQEQIFCALTHCKLFVAYIEEGFFESEYCVAELNRAIALDKDILVLMESTYDVFMNMPKPKGCKLTNGKFDSLKQQSTKDVYVDIHTPTGHKTNYVAIMIQHFLLHKESINIDQIDHIIGTTEPEDVRSKTVKEWWEVLTHQKTLENLKNPLQYFVEEAKAKYDGHCPGLFLDVCPDLCRDALAFTSVSFSSSSDKNGMKLDEKCMVEKVYTKNQTVLVEGDPGVGKSTLCNYIANMWGTVPKRLGLEVFDLVVKVNVKDLSKVLGESGILSRKVIFQCCFPEATDNHWDKFKSSIDKCKVFYILDSVDEAIDVTNGSKAIYTLMQNLVRMRSLCRIEYCLITSRPGYFDDNLEETLKFHRLYLVGFNEKSRDEYISKYPNINKSRKRKLVQTLFSKGFHVSSESSSIVGTNPLMLEMLCYCFQTTCDDDEKNYANPPQTLTDVYARLLTKRLPDTNVRKAFKEISLETRRKRIVNIWLQCLEELAFSDATEFNVTFIQNVMFPDGGETEATTYVSNEQIYSEFLRLNILRGKSKKGLRVHEFTHETFREFFKAKAVLRKARSGQGDFIKRVEFRYNESLVKFYQDLIESDTIENESTAKRDLYCALLEEGWFHDLHGQMYSHGFRHLLLAFYDPLRGNPKILDKILKGTGDWLSFQPEEIKDDRLMVISCVRKIGLVLEFASEVLKNDEDIVLKAVEQNGCALQFASEELKNDKRCVLKAVEQNGDALKYASEELQNNKVIVLKAVQKNGNGLQYASKELQNDQDCVLKAVEQNGRALGYASEELKNDKVIVLKAVQNYGLALQYTSQKLKNDKDCVLKAVQNDGWALRFVSEELRNNKDCVLKAVENNGWALQFVSEELKNDKDCVLKAVENIGDALRYASEELKNDKDCVFKAFKNNRDALKYASEELRNDKMFLKLLELWT